MRFFGHVVLALSVFVDPEKVKVVMSWERPKSVFKIRIFLGLAGYYRRFIEDFSREGVSRIEEEAYFNSYSDSPGKGIEVHSLL